MRFVKKNLKNKCWQIGLYCTSKITYFQYKNWLQALLTCIDNQIHSYSARINQTTSSSKTPNWPFAQTSSFSHPTAMRSASSIHSTASSIQVSLTVHYSSHMKRPDPNKTIWSFQCSPTNFHYPAIVMFRYWWLGESTVICQSQADVSPAHCFKRENWNYT
jgi:hypothetical protein